MEGSSMGEVTAFRKVVERTPSLVQLVDEFLIDLKTENKSQHTIKNYQADLKAFLRFYKGSLSELSPAILREYFGSLVDTLSPASLSRKQASLKSFLRWAFRHDLIPANPMDKIGAIRLPDSQPRFLPMAQVNKILSVITHDRDKVLFTLISETGLRISEALALRVEDLRQDAQEFTVRGKGQKERTIHLVKTESLRLLKWFMRKYQITDGLIFRPNEAKQRYGLSGKPVEYSVVAKAWKRYSQEAGIDCTIHCLRHSHATDLINKGAPVEVVGKILGHKNLQTTLRYAKVSDQTVKCVLERIK